jgi:hypothetical protein
MKYWVKYIIIVAIVFAICGFIKLIPFWITSVIIAFVVGCHLFYTHFILKDAIK